MIDASGASDPQELLDGTPAHWPRAIVAAATEAVIGADREGIIRLWNRGAEALFGHTAAAVLGASLDVIIPEPLRAAHWAGFHRAIGSGQSRLAGRAITTRSMHKDGRKLYVDLSFGLIVDEHGHVTGAYAIGRDCTERQQAERSLRARVAELEQALGDTKRAEPPPRT